MHITVLDLGSTTFHAQTFAVGSDGQFVTRFDDRRALHLGRDVYRSGRIGEDKWHAAITTVGELLDATRRQHSDVTIAVATSVLRDAANGLAFRVELWNRYRLGVQLLTPEQEARFTYLGASTDPHVGGRRVAVIDLGGGSLELAVGEGTRCLYAESLPLGALHVRARLGEGSDALSPAALGTVHDRVRQVGKDVLAQVRALGPERVVFASGTARNARLQAMQGSGAAGKTGVLRAARLREVLAYDEERPGVHADDAVQVAQSIMLATLDVLEAPEAFVSDKGLRDGVALDVMRRAPRQESSVAVRTWNRRLASLASVPANLARRD
jgi:exopolyphosphatase/guanosine-5'-triphosphate,3'-diphosphate pyrophosphatase